MHQADFPEKRDRVKKLKLVETTVHGKRRWKLIGHYINGVRNRKFFLRKADGERYIEELDRTTRDLGARASSVPGWLHEQAIEANAILAPFGISIVDAAKEVADWATQQRQSAPFAEVASLFLKSREAKGRKSRHLQDVRVRTARFSANFGTRLVSDITTPEVDRWLDRLNLAPTTTNNFRSILHNVFQFAVAQGLASVNPVSSIATSTVVSTVPSIFSVAEMEALLSAATPSEIPYLAIGAFSGLRTAELSRLKWTDIKFDEKLIEVTAVTSKTASRRLVTISDNLSEWLAPFRLNTGSIIPQNFRKKLSLTSRKAGFGRPGTETTAELDHDIIFKPWPQNGLRHSFASYHLAQWKDAARTALEMGHSTTKLLFQHYRELVKPVDADRYWNISPTSLGRPS